ncbi:DUF4998 domain-containing protein [Butyricimonas hominis]|uniref:DUF4998 domain-containing protein n=1 Tax=Butyricimonas TaxID=574697 RepID=UPI003513C1C4
MKGKRYITCLLAVVVMLASCSESLEETYEDYAGDGKIRYVGKCSGLAVIPGWKRLTAKWKNSQDVTIENIKVLWSTSDLRDSVLLPAVDTSCDIRNLENGTYRVDVCSVDKNGRTSLVETMYGRPYTEEHEVVRTFTRGITKFYKIGNNLAFFLDSWSDNIEAITLHYTGTNQNAVDYPLTREVFNQQFVVLGDVDTSKPITVKRSGKLEGCPDLILFEDYELEDELNVSSDFKYVMQWRYGLQDRTEEQLRDFRHFLDTVKVLEFDYDMTTFEDILYCKNLQKVVLGKNRYLHPEYRFSRLAEMSTLREERRSIRALNAVSELLGVTIERYNTHYFKGFSKPTNMVEMGNPGVPDLEFIPVSMIDTITDSQEVDSFDSSLESLIDNDPSTWWEPMVSPLLRSHEIVIALKEAQVVNGVKVAQKTIDPSMDRISQYYMPKLIRLQYSSDQVIWTDVTFISENILGNGSGEITLFPMKEPKEIKYLKVIVDDQLNTNVYNVALADISLY